MSKEKPNPFRARPEGQEKPMDTTPVEMPMGYITPTPLQDLIARMVRQAVEEEKDDEFESIEEADDFDMPDDDLLDMSPYEFDDLEEEEPIERPQTPSEAPQETNSTEPSANNSGGDENAIGKSSDAQTPTKEE